MFQTYPYSTNLGVEYQSELLNEPHRELPILSDGRASFALKTSLQQAARWLEAQVTRLGENVPCVGLEPACDMRFTA